MEGKETSTTKIIETGKGNVIAPAATTSGPVRRVNRELASIGVMINQ